MGKRGEEEVRALRADAERALDANGTGGTTRLLVVRLLEMYWRSGLEDPELERAVSLFLALARGHALPTARQAEHRWAQARPGQLVVRDYVRVRMDAYQGGLGKAHNGRSGPIVAIRHGDIIVRYDDGGPVPAMGVRHSPHVLEKRIDR